MYINGDIYKLFDSMIIHSILIKIYIKILNYQKYAYLDYPREQMNKYE